MVFLYQVYIVITNFTIIIILIFILPPWDPPWWPPGRPWWPPGRPCPRLCWSSVSSGSPEDSSVAQTDTRASIILCIQCILFCCCSELLSENMSCICTFFNFTTLRWCRICARTGMTQSEIANSLLNWISATAWDTKQSEIYSHTNNPKPVQERLVQCIQK